MIRVFGGEPLSDVVDIGAGSQAVCAVTAQGELFCWGNGFLGLSGDPQFGDRIRPTRLDVPAELVEVSLGDVTALARAVDGSLWHWGDWSTGPRSATPTLFSGIVADDLPESAPYCVLNGGAVHCQGDNHWGQLGVGADVDASDAFIPVTSLSGVRQLAHGQEEVCAVLQDRSVSCWGRAVTGLPDLFDAAYLPVDMGLPTPVESVHVGAFQAIAIDLEGRIYRWGRFDGQVAFAPPTLVPGLPPVRDVAIGFGTTCVLTREDARVLCWGVNHHNIVGPSGLEDPHVPHEVQVPASPE